MGIADCELLAVHPRWLLLKLETDEGIVGWGETIHQRTLDSDVQMPAGGQSQNASTSSCQS